MLFIVQEKMKVVRTIDEQKTLRYNKQKNKCERRYLWIAVIKFRG